MAIAGPSEDAESKEISPLWCWRVLANGEKPDNLAGLASTHTLKIQSLAIGPTVAFRTIVPLLKIQRTMDRTVVFTVSGRLDAENVGELCRLIDAEPAGTVVVLDLTDLVLADRDAVRLLRDCETGERMVLRNCPAYIRVWMAAEENL